MRNVTIVVIAALLLAACSSTQEIYEVPPGAAGAAGAGADGELILPQPIPAAPAYSLEVRKPISPSRLRRLARVRGVAVVAPVRSRRVAVRGPDGRRRLEVGVIESLRFRSVAPPAMRDADFVWLSLVTGDAVATFAAADRLGLRAGDAVKIARVGPVAVGAWADNAPRPVVDVLLDEQHAEALGGAPRAVLVGAKSGVTLQMLAEDLKRVLPRARLRRIVPAQTRSAPRPPAPRVVTTTTSASTAITGLHPALAAALQRLLAAAGGRIWIVSGFRSTAHQRILWQAALERYGDPEVADNWVAPPGSSYHELGLAVDLGGDLEYAAALMRKLGLPLWRPMSWEPWHFELVGSRG